MKKIWVFILGIVTGIILFLMFSVIYANSSQNVIQGLEMFKEKGECISKKNFKVFQSLGTAGLAIDKGTSSFADIYNGIHVLFMSPDGKPFYDEQVIFVPKNKCARQIGIYHYETTEQKWKTVPVVEID